MLTIRERYAAGHVNQRDLGKEYGVAPSAISNVITRITWNHVT